MILRFKFENHEFEHACFSTYGLERQALGNTYICKICGVHAGAKTRVWGKGPIRLWINMSDKSGSIIHGWYNGSLRNDKKSCAERKIIRDMDEALK